MNKFRMYLLPNTKGKELMEFYAGISDSSYLGLPNSRFFKLYLRIIGYFEGLAMIAESRSQNYDAICIIRIGDLSFMGRKLSSYTLSI